MLWLKHFFTKGKSLKDAIKYFHTINGRMPNNLETIKMKNAFMEQTRGADVIQFPKDRITNPFKPRPGDVKKTDENPLNTLLSRQSDEIKGVDTNQGMGFYREMGDIMKKHRREELELEYYDEMFNKILDKAKRIEADPKVLLEAELGKKITGEETATQLLEFFKNRPKKASGGLAREGYAGGGKLVKWLSSLGKKKKPKKPVDQTGLITADDLEKSRKKYGLDEKTLKKDEEAFKLRLQEILAKHSTKHAEGGLARVALGKGGAAGKLFMEFIEKLFIKSSNDIRLGKGKWAGLTQKQIMIQHENLTKKMMEWQKSGKTVGLDEYFGVDPHTAYIDSLTKVKKAEIKKLKKAQAEEKKLTINRKLTNDELDDLYEEFDEAVPYPMETVRDKEKFLKAVKDEEAYMFQEYKAGRLDPKPEATGKKLSKPTKTLEGLKKEGTIDISDPEVADEFSRFIKESDPEGYKKLEQQIKSDDLFDAEGKLNKKAVLQEVRDSEEKMLLEKLDVTGKKGHASGGIAGQLHLNRQGYANGELAGWEFKTPDKKLREFTPEEIEKQRELIRDMLKKRKEFWEKRKNEDSLGVSYSKEMPEEQPPFQGPDYETNIPKEAGKEILRRILGGGHENPPIGGGFAFDVPYGAGKPYDYGIQYQPGGSDFSTYYGIKEDGENVYGGGYQGENFGAGVRKEEGGDPTFGFEFKKKLKKKKKPIFGKAKGGRVSFTKGGLAKILGV